MEKVRFNLKNKNKKESLIILKMQRNKKRLVYSTGLKIPTKYWSDTTMRPKRNALYRESSDITDTLNLIETKVYEIQREENRKDLFLSNNEFKEELTAKLKGRSILASESVNVFLKKFISHRVNVLRLKSGSVKHYKAWEKHLLDINGGKDLKFDELNVAMYESFIAHFEKMKCGDNYIYKLMDSLKVVLEDAKDKGLEYKDKLVPSKLGCRKHDSDNIYLTVDEIARIRSVKLINDKNGRLENVRDMFLLGCYTGLRYSNLVTLNASDIYEIDGQKLIKLFTIKTDNDLVIPLKPHAHEILIKRKKNRLKFISNQKINDYIKEIAELAGIDDIVKIRSHIAKRVIVNEYKKFEQVTSHTARRSFATNAYLANVPMLTIMKFTGHKKVSTFMKYIKIEGQQYAQSMKDHEFFKE